MKKSHHDRMALLDRLEKKYARKLELHRMQKKQKSLKQSLRIMRGRQLADNTFDDMNDMMLFMETKSA